MSSWTSYPSSFNLGHRAVRTLLDYPHVVEEKVDGSQFSFGMFRADDGDLGPDYETRVRSKGAIMVTEAPEKMFNKAVETAKRICSPEAIAAGVGAHPGWTYRCEYLAKPKHNTLAYDRHPVGHLIGFDVSTGDQEWLDPLEKLREFQRIGLECVPMLARGGGDTSAISMAQLRDILDTTRSVLGGQLIEGVVIKPFRCEVYGPDHKTLIGKFVSERFKEAHREAWKVTSPPGRGRARPVDGPLQGYWSVDEGCSTSARRRGSGRQPPGHPEATGRGSERPGSRGERGDSAVTVEVGMAPHITQCDAGPAGMVQGRTVEAAIRVRA